LGPQFRGFPQPALHEQAVQRMIAAVPAGASVSTLSDLVPHLSAREEIYLFPTMGGAEYILFDTDTSANYWPIITRDARSDAARVMLDVLDSGQYGLIKEEDGVLLLRKGADHGANSAAVAALLSGTFLGADLPSDFVSANSPDPQASGGMARVGRPQGERLPDKNALAFGPWVSMQPGRYRVEFRLKIPDGTQQGRVATLDVFSNQAGGALAGRDIDAAEFDAAGRYAVFALDLEIREPLPDVEYRVLYPGNGEVWLDSVRVVYLGQ
jgi:hypothetical protein